MTDAQLSGRNEAVVYKFRLIAEVSNQFSLKELSHRERGKTSLWFVLFRNCLNTHLTLSGITDTQNMVSWRLSSLLFCFFRWECRATQRWNVPSRSSVNGKPSLVPAPASQVLAQHSSSRFHLVLVPWFLQIKTLIPTWNSMISLKEDTKMLPKLEQQLKDWVPSALFLGCSPELTTKHLSRINQLLVYLCDRGLSYLM